MLQNTNTQAPAKEFTMTTMFVTVLITIVVTAVIAFAIGDYFGVHQYILTCMHYPFLLLDPSQYIACPMP